jgi:glycosyltransferase involved in cell wall biosynthesis
MSYAPSEPTLRLQETDSSSSFLAQNNSKIQNPAAPKRRKKVNSRSAPLERSSFDHPIIVHSHLCWDWVWQRPQQFVARLSRRHKILFIETLAPDPGLAAPLARFRTANDSPNVTILTIQFPAWRWGDGAYVDGERRRLVQQFVEGPGAPHFKNPIQWFYDPMAVTSFAGRMGEILTVYDCMDELSKFSCAPPEIAKRETELLGRADVVFTGGRKLFEVKSRLHGNCHFYGCGVDGAHFGQARLEATPLPPDLAKLNRPALGYFGVVDERLDYELIARLADADPNWSVVMIGPTMKVDRDSLPKRPNLHWLGQRPYSDLPSFCKGFDVCLMPFARNEATEFINPTKALEYMATGRMIVSTAVPDVVRNFGTVVKIAATREEFVSLSKQAAAHPDPAAIKRGLDMAGENSWDAIVSQLERHMEEALAQCSAGRAAA